MSHLLDKTLCLLVVATGVDVIIGGRVSNCVRGRGEFERVEFVIQVREWKWVLSVVVLKEDRIVKEAVTSVGLSFC